MSSCGACGCSLNLHGVKSGYDDPNCKCQCHTLCLCNDHPHEGGKDKCAACDCAHLPDMSNRGVIEMPVEPQTFLETQGENAGKIMTEASHQPKTVDGLVESKIVFSAREIAKDPAFVRTFARCILNGEYMGESFEQFCERISTSLYAIADWLHDPRYPKVCKCGGEYEMGTNAWASRICCNLCHDHYDL